MGNVRIISNIEQGISNDEGKREKGDLNHNPFEYPSISFQNKKRERSPMMKRKSN